MNKHNKNISLMFAQGYRPEDSCEWIDAYNKTVIRGGLCGTIHTGISFRNQSFILIEL